jgi:dTDP-4-amino-4,6-dideoxygalactose transaminase
MIMDTLEEENIESRPVWKPMHLQPYYRQFPFFTALEEGSVSGDLFNRGVCLPSDTKMTELDLKKVTSLIKRLFQ